MNNEGFHSAIEKSLSRRTTLKIIGLGAASAVIPSILNKYETQGQASTPTLNPQSDLITNEIPRTKERIPAIGMGTFLTFDVLKTSPAPIFSKSCVASGRAEGERLMFHRSMGCPR